MIIWNPFREVLNVPLAPIRLLFWWVEDLWHFIPETLLFIAIQGGAIGYICTGKECSFDEMVLNDTQGTFIVCGFITALLLSLHWAVFYMVLAAIEVGVYSGYYIDKQGLEDAGEL